jgi:hypothetical protein
MLPIAIGCSNALKQLKEKCKQLLAIAKTGVERAMLLQSGYTNETDETTATTWINSSLKPWR